MRCFIVIAIQLCFRMRVCYQEGPSKTERTGFERNTSAPGLCWWF